MAGEWRNVALEDVADELTVGYVGSMASEYVDDGIPFLRSLNVDPLRINKNDLKFITPEFHRRIRKSRLTPGDVVIVRTGKPGACSVVPEWLADANCSDLVIVRCGPQLDNRFLAYYVNTIACDHVAAHLVGAVQQHFNVGSARTLRLNLPPLAEQKAIAAVLGALDDKIECNRRMNATLEAMARALFQSWFVDFDPVRAKVDGRTPAHLDPATAALFPDSFQESELGPIPNAWHAARVGEVSSRIAMGPFGSRITRDNFVPTGIPVIRGGNLTNGFVDDDFVFLTESKADELKASVARSLDIVFTHRGTLGQVGIIPIGSRYPRYVVSQSQMFLSVDREKLSPWAAYLFFSSSQGEAALLANTSTTGVPAISRPTTSLKAIPLVIPPIAVSKRFDELVQPLFLQREQLEQESRTLAALRDALLPRLLSGELRVAGG